MNEEEIDKLINDGIGLFKNKKYTEAIEILEKAQGQSTDTKKELEVLLGLGRCYFKKKDFEQASDFFLRLLDLAEQENHIEIKSTSLHWLGRCYFEQKDFNKAIEIFSERLTLAKKENNVKDQLSSLYWLGQCYFGQKDFSKATEIFNKQLILAEQENDVSEQFSSLYWLGQCYFKQKDFSKTIEIFQSQLNLAEKQQNINEQLKALFWIGGCYYNKWKKTNDSSLFDIAYTKLKEIRELTQSLNDENLKREWIKKLNRNLLLLKKYEEYFEEKKKIILNDLFQQNYQNEKLENCIATILAVLNIHPIELGNIPLAHYTSPIVCENLFGLNGKERSDMRMGSSTYMNDPTEGNVLLELLNQQDLELDNKRELSPYNAFFACLSTRVNDLNQFRLYGKEEGVEASGCCLVLNKNGNWLQDTDIASSYRPLVNGEKELSTLDDEIKSNESPKLPLYQVAYIAYLDEYIKDGKCKIKLSVNNSKFGVLLNDIGNNKKWHEVRKKKLEEALIKLMEYFKTEKVSEEDKNKLEYIRYLFKDFAFRDEEEFRLMQIEKMDSDKIHYCDKTNSIYVPYADITDMVDEIILGTNYEKTNQKRKVEMFRYHMKKKSPNIHISHSSLPINANLPHLKEGNPK